MTRKQLVAALRVLREDAEITKLNHRARRLDIHFTEAGKDGLLVIPLSNERIKKLQTKSK